MILHAICPSSPSGSAVYGVRRYRESIVCHPKGNSVASISALTHVCILCAVVCENRNGNSPESYCTELWSCQSEASVLGEDEGMRESGGGSKAITLREPLDHVPLCYAKGIEGSKKVCVSMSCNHSTIEKTRQAVLTISCHRSMAGSVLSKSVMQNEYRFPSASRRKHPRESSNSFAWCHGY